MKDLPTFWIKNEIKEQRKKIDELNKSGMLKLKGVNLLMDMRKQFLQIAETVLKNVECQNIQIINERMCGKGQYDT